MPAGLVPAQVVVMCDTTTLHRVASPVAQPALSYLFGSKLAYTSRETRLR